MKRKQGIIEKESLVSKGKKLKVGQSQNPGPIQFKGYNEILFKAELESSPINTELESEQHKIVLKCGHPYSISGHISLIYDTNSNLYGNYSIHRHNSKDKFVLIHKKYQITLKQWLKKNKNNWSPIYGNWGVNRPKEVVRQIIQGILRAVYDFHSNGSFHGFLCHTDNYLIRCDNSVIGGDCKETKHIFLIHENVEFKENFVPTKKIDIGDLSNVIFNQILEGKSFLEYPEDLKDLKTQLEISDDLEHIVNHPSLWHWNSRYNYIERVWSLYRNADINTKGSMMVKFRMIKVEGWQDKIDHNLLDWMFYDNNGQPRYKDTVQGLLRFLRNVRVHYKEHIRHLPDTMQAIYPEKQYIEQITSQVSELFLVHLYKTMCEMKIMMKIEI